MVHLKVPRLWTDGTERSYGNTPLEKPMAREFKSSGKLREYEQPKLTEVYGFVYWLTSGLALIIFLLWAQCQRKFGMIRVTYYPSCYWAIAVLAQVVILTFHLSDSYWYWFSADSSAGECNVDFDHIHARLVIYLAYQGH